MRAPDRVALPDSIDAVPPRLARTTLLLPTRPPAGRGGRTIEAGWSA
jgi:hypothetical protein